MKKVLFVSNIPSPYNVDYLNALGTLRSVTAVFEREHSSERDKSWKDFNAQNFSCQILKGISVGKDKAISLGVLGYIHRFRKEHIIIGNPLTPTGMIALLYCRLFRIPFILQSEGGFRGSGKGLKEKFKKFLMTKARLYLSGMRGESEYFLGYGATADKLRWYPFTSLQADAIDEKPVSAEQQQQARELLGIPEPQMVISVGRPIPVKGFDVLLEAKRALPEDVGLYFVGGKATEEYLRFIETHRLKNVHFVEHCSYETLRKYYHAADLFILATRGDTWGLVINEAMANGLPVITTNRCVAGLQLIEEDVNGYIVPVDDSLAMAEKIKQLLDDKTLREKMAANNIEKIQPYTIENMAKTIAAALEELESE